jgi:hypothetical protein
MADDGAVSKHRKVEGRLLFGRHRHDERAVRPAWIGLFKTPVV